MKLVLFLLVSLLIHLSFLLFVPNYFAVTKLRIFPIELVEPKELYLERFLKRSEGKEAQKEKLIKQFLVDEDKRREDFLMSKLRELSLGESIDVPGPSFLVPQRQEGTTPEERVRLLRSSPFFEDLGRLFRESSRSLGHHRGTIPSADMWEVEIPKRRILEERGTRGIIAQMTVQAHARRPPARSLDEDTVGIKGPASKRRVLYKPEIPVVEIDREGEVELKFWVLPDGSVGSVFPLLRGDPELERIGIDYVKQWRFDPLEEGGSTVEQWGTVTVRFNVQ